MKKLMDKDKLLLLFNLYVGDMDREDWYNFTQETANSFRGYFDDSVKCIFAITEDESKPSVQNITEFPTDGMDMIRELVRLYESKDKEALDIQIKAVKNFLEEYQNEREAN